MAAVRRAGPDDTAGVAAGLARAFLPDPVAEFLFPDSAGREQRLRAFFSFQLRQSYLPRGEVLTVEGYRSAALYLPAGTAPPGLWERLSQVGLVPILGSQFLLAGRLGSLLARVHPKEPHFYLGVIGTEPMYQGRGYGSAVLAAMLERCDAAAVPAYLECSRRSTLAFYARHGFRVTGELGLSGGPTIYPMWRDASDAPSPGAAAPGAEGARG